MTTSAQDSESLGNVALGSGGPVKIILPKSPVEFIYCIKQPRE